MGIRILIRSKLVEQIVLLNCVSEEVHDGSAVISELSNTFQNPQKFMSKDVNQKEKEAQTGFYIYKFLET
jgi:hypothetical protein